MKKILLVSMLCNVTGLLKKAEPDLNGKTVTYIPTAAIAEEIEGMAEAETRMLEELGLTVDELEVSTASKDNVREKLAKNDMIFVGGGNTFFLLQELKRSGADQIIAREAEKGKLYRRVCRGDRGLPGHRVFCGDGCAREGAGTDRLYGNGAGGFLCSSAYGAPGDGTRSKFDH